MKNPITTSCLRSVLAQQIVRRTHRSEIVRRAGALLGQEKMYFERTGSRVEFLDSEPPKEDEQ